MSGDSRGTLRIEERLDTLNKLRNTQLYASAEQFADSRFGGTVLTVGPGFTWLFLFLILPLTIVAVYSFGQMKEMGEVLFGVEYFTLSQYSTILVREGSTILDTLWLVPVWILDRVVPMNLTNAAPTAYVKTIVKSIWIGLITTVACLLFGYPMAYYIARKVPDHWRNPMLLFVVLPWWASFLARIYAVKILLSEQSLLIAFLQNLPTIPPDFQVLYTRTAVIFGLVYVWIPLMILPAYSSIEQLDESLLDAARDLGADRWQSFRRVTLPLTMPGILAGGTLIFILSSGAYVIPELLGGPNSQMIGNQIASVFGQGGNWAFGSALSFSFSTVILVILIAYLRFGGGEIGDL